MQYRKNRVYRGITGRESVGAFRPIYGTGKQPFLDGYENPLPNHNFDPRPLSERIRSEILRQERVGHSPRYASHVLIPQHGIWRKMGHRTFYRLFGLHYFNRDNDPKTSGLQAALQNSHSRVFVKDGTYPLSATSNYFASTTLNKWYMGVHLEGETAAGQLSTTRGDVLGPGAATRGAYFTWTGPNGGTMLQTSPQNKYPNSEPVINAAGFVFGQLVENIGFDPGTQRTQPAAAGIGLDLSIQETGVKTTVRNVWCGRYSSNGFGNFNGFSIAGLVMDGNEDSNLEQYFTGGGTGTDNNAVDVFWYVQVGNVHIYASEMAGIISMSLCAQSVGVIDSTASNVQVLGTSTSQPSAWLFNSVYFANDTTHAGLIQLNNKQVHVMKFLGCPLKPSAASPMILGPGTLTNLSFSGNWLNNVNAVSWSSGAPTLTKQSTDGTNYNINGQPTGSPFTTDGNGNW